MEKIKYSGECELKTRTAYQQGCFFPTMLRIQEVCCERNTDGHYPVRCFTHYDYFIMDDEQRLKWELEERYENLGETNIHCLCHIVQTIPIGVSSKPIRERVYNFCKFISDYSEIEDESISKVQKQFIPGELGFVLKDDSLTIGVVITNSVDSMSYPMLVLDVDGECHEEQVPISRVLKYRDILEHIDVEDAYKLKKQLYNLNDAPADSKIPIWLGWRFFETTCKAEEFGMMVYTVPIPCSHAANILGKEVELSEDGWHYRIAGDESKEERMLWGYKNMLTFDNLPIHRVEKIIQSGFPIGFSWRLPRLKKLITMDGKDKSIEYHRKYIRRFLIGYADGIRQMSQNNIDILAEQISWMEKLFANGEYLPEQKEEMLCTIEDGKRVLGQLKVIQSFSPYGILEMVDPPTMLNVY